VQAGAIITPALPEIASHFADQPNAALLSRLVLTLPMLAIACASPLAGWVVDRFGRTPVLRAAIVLYAMAGASGLVLDDLHALLLSRVFVGIAVAGIATSTTTLIGDYFEGDTRTRLLGQQWSAMALASIVCLTTAGFLGELHWRAPFALYGLGLLVLPAVILLLPEPGRQEGGIGRHDGGDKAFWAAALLGCGLSGTSMIAFYMVPSQLPFRLAEMGLPSPALAGLAVAFLNVVAAPVAMAHRRIRARIGAVAIFAVTFACLALAFIVIAEATGIGAIFASMFLAGVAGGGMILNITVWVVTRTPAPIRGRVVGGLSMSMFLGQFLSPFYSQPLAEAIGLGPAFGVTAAWLAGFSLLFLALALRQWRRSP